MKAKCSKFRQRLLKKFWKLEKWQNFERSELSKFWKLRAFKIKKANSRYLIFASDFIAFKILPAICFQKFASNLLSKSFQKFPSDLLSKSFQKFSSDLLSKLLKQIAGKNLPASFQIFESYLKAILSRENQDGRHQGNHRHNALD